MVIPILLHSGRFSLLVNPLFHQMSFFLTVRSFCQSSKSIIQPYRAKAEPRWGVGNLKAGMDLAECWLSGLAKTETGRPDGSCENARLRAPAWVSKPRHRSPLIRLGADKPPGPGHGLKILRPGILSRGRHASPPGKRGCADLNNDLQPVPASTRICLLLASRKPAV